VKLYLFFALAAGLSFFPRGLEGFFMILSPSLPGADRPQRRPILARFRAAMV
jgi:hypothetical protein